MMALLFIVAGLVLFSAGFVVGRAQPLAELDPARDEPWWEDRL